MGPVLNAPIGALSSWIWHLRTVALTGVWQFLLSCKQRLSESRRGRKRTEMLHRGSGLRLWTAVCTTFNSVGGWGCTFRYWMRSLTTRSGMKTNSRSGQQDSVECVLNLILWWKIQVTRLGMNWWLHFWSSMQKGCTTADLDANNWMRTNNREESETSSNRKVLPGTSSRRENFVNVPKSIVHCYRKSSTAGESSLMWMSTGKGMNIKKCTEFVDLNVSTVLSPPEIIPAYTELPPRILICFWYGGKDFDQALHKQNAWET